MPGCGTEAFQQNLGDEPPATKDNQSLVSGHAKSLFFDRLLAVSQFILPSCLFKFEFTIYIIMTSNQPPK
jgi:hypothetical protein